MSITANKVAETLFEQQLETYEDQMMLIDKTQVFTPEGGTMQNAGNVIWRPKEQHRPIIEGWDLTGQETGIIEEAYPAYLGTPKNDFVSVRVDNMRDKHYWEDAGRTSGRQQATELNKSVANLIATSGSLHYRSNTVSGFDFISEGQAIMNERQGKHTQRCFVLNDRDTRKFGQDLAGRQTVRGRPEDTWMTGQIGSNVAEFDVYTGSFLPNIVGGADPATTTTAAASFKPEGGTVAADSYDVSNVDYRKATIAVTSSAGYNVGDKITIANGGTTIKSVGLADKTNTGQAMTFTVVAKPDATSMTIMPKPIALDDGSLSTLEKSYANVDTTITSGATINRVNTDASARANLFWDKDAIEVVGGEVPMQMLGDLDGMKVISQPLSNGLNMYMVYDANIANLQLRYRTFVWYGLTMKDPSRAGVATTF